MFNDVSIPSTEHYSIIVGSVRTGVFAGGVKQPEPSSLTAHVVTRDPVILESGVLYISGDAANGRVVIDHEGSRLNVTFDTEGDTVTMAFAQGDVNRIVALRG